VKDTFCPLFTSWGPNNWTENRAEYKGQMELYLRWLAKYEREADEALPLGIILCAGASTRCRYSFTCRKSSAQVFSILNR
jgi:hypothetical protein